MLAALLVVEELKLVYLCRGGEGGVDLPFGRYTQKR